MAGTIVFSHANGFPASTYRVLFQEWQRAGFTVRAIEKFGHDPRYPVTSNWPHLIEQLTEFIGHAAAGPAFLVGHSLGGFLSLMAACQRPDLARGVVLLDSPVIYGWKAKGLQLFKRTGWVRKVSPGRVSQQRRQQWAHRDAVLDHFRSKPTFARWHPDTLSDYVERGTREENGRRVLSFSREVETEIYNTLPHHIHRLVRHHPPQCPVAFIGGRQSTEVRQVGLRATQRITQGRISWIDGTHLFPFEQPLETAQAVTGWLHQFG